MVITKEGPGTLKSIDPGKALVRELYLSFFIYVINIYCILGKATISVWGERLFDNRIKLSMHQFLVVFNGSG